jgi:hypothetical protein
MADAESDLIPHSPERKLGLPPGSVVFMGEERTEPIEFRVLEYGPDHLVETDRETVDEVLKYRDTTPITWINVSGVHDESVRSGITFTSIPSSRRTSCTRASGPSSIPRTTTFIWS